MTNHQRIDYVTRYSILTLLSDEEAASVSTTEAVAKLSDGDEYVDLQRLANGVQRAHGIASNMGGVLPRKAVQEQTWSQILTELEVRSTAVRP